MKVLKNIFGLILLMAMVGCGTVQVLEQETNLQAEVEAPTEFERVYYFQHKLIPKWLFESNGQLYLDLRVKNADQLIKAADEIVSTSFSNDIEIIPIEGREAVLVNFSEPNAPPNCYFVLILKNGDDFEYYTYEKTISIDSSDIYGVVGGWDKDGGHLNYGARNYRKYEQFVTDVLN